MTKFVPYEKLSKKKRRAMDRSRRGTWGAVSPVTRKPDSLKVYNRKKAHRWEEDDREESSD